MSEEVGEGDFKESNEHFRGPLVTAYPEDLVIINKRM